MKNAKYVKLQKGQTQNLNTYTLLSIPNVPSEDISIDFGQLKTHSTNSTFIIVDCFFQITHFILYKKTTNTSYIINLYFNEVVQLYRTPKSIVSNRDIKFLVIFGEAY